MLGDYPVALKEYRAFIRRMAFYSNKEINEDSTLYQAIQSSYDFYNNHLKSRDSLTQVDIVNNYLNQYNYWTNFLSDNQNHPGYILRRAEFQVFIHFHISLCDMLSAAHMWDELIAVCNQMLLLRKSS